MHTIPDFPYARYADMIGLTGISVYSPDEIGPAWEQALNADRPVVIDALCDPDFPPLPPHITFEQARGFFSSFVKGDPDRFGMTRQSIKQMTAKLSASDE